MVDWLVFSRDRACQLDALLRGLDWYAPHLTRSVSVIYRATDDEHEAGYRQLRGLHRPVSFTREAHVGGGARGPAFADAVHTWLAPGRVAVGFLCDDDLWLRAPPLAALSRMPFSCRLGRNTVYQHPTGLGPYRPPKLEPVGETVLSFEWEGANGDFGYPLSLDGHIYEPGTIRDLVEQVRFTDPTTLEAGLASIAHRFRPRRIQVAAAGSSLVSVPANRVTENSHNPIMDSTGDLRPSRLLERFLAGDRINPWATARRYAGLVDAAHFELIYEWGTL